MNKEAEYSENQGKFEIICGDITAVQADVIVNSANERLKQGGGVCGAIFKAAGAKELTQACRKIGHCKTGKSVITSGFNLSEYIIHTVGSVWRGGRHGEAGLLKNCYRSSLELAVKHGCKSIAFPLISAGIYGYPREAAFDIAVGEITEFTKKHDINVVLVLKGE